MPHTVSMSVSARIRALRKQRGYTVEMLANEVGVHKGHLSRIERGEKTPSLGTLETIASVLNVGMAELFGEKAGADEVTVVRKLNRKTLGKRKDYRIEALLASAENRPLSAYVVSPETEFQKHDVPHHNGQELLFVLKGKIELVVGGKTVQLTEGDCASYDAALHHQLRRIGQSPASLLVVIGRL